MARKGSKNAIIEKFLAEVDKAKVLDEKLSNMFFETKQVNYGEYLNHNLHDNYHYRWLFGGVGRYTADTPCKLYGNGKKKAKLSSYAYHLSEFVLYAKQLEQFIEKAEQRELIETP